MTDFKSTMDLLLIQYVLDNRAYVTPTTYSTSIYKFLEEYTYKRTYIKTLDCIYLVKKQS